MRRYSGTAAIAVPLKIMISGFVSHQYALTWFIHIQQDMIRSSFIQLEVLFKCGKQGL